MQLLLSKLLQYVLLSTKEQNIDESHGISHSLNVIDYSYKIYEEELPKTPRLINDLKIIIASAAIHDMCDHKYINVTQGTQNIENYLMKETTMTNEEISVTTNIITTMSYSKIKLNGYPELGKYQQAYHIVREADLLSSYDFNRAVIYDMMKNNCTMKEAFDNSYKLFYKRMFQYCNNELFVHDYSKKEAHKLHSNSIKQINNWRRLLQYK